MADKAINNTYIKGGGNYITFYTHTTGTIGDLQWSSKLVEETKPTMNDDGSYSFAITMYNDNKDFYDFIAAYTTRAVGGTITGTLEDGTPFSTATAGATELVCVIYGGVTNEQTPMRKLWAGTVNLSNKSGAWTQKGATLTTPVLEFQSVKASTDIEITSKLDAGFVTVGVNTYEIEKESLGSILFIAKA